MKNKTAVRLHTIPYIVASSLRLGVVIHSDVTVHQDRIGRQKNWPVSAHVGKYCTILFLCDNNYFPVRATFRAWFMVSNSPNMS